MLDNEVSKPKKSVIFYFSGMMSYKIVQHWRMSSRYALSNLPDIHTIMEILKNQNLYAGFPTLRRNLIVSFPKENTNTGLTQRRLFFSYPIEWSKIGN